MSLAKRWWTVFLFAVGMAAFFPVSVQARWHWWYGNPVTSWQYGMFNAINYWSNGFYVMTYPSLPSLPPRPPYQAQPNPISPAPEKSYPNYDIIANHQTCEAELYQDKRFIHVLRPMEGVRVRRNQNGWRVSLRVRTTDGNSEKQPGKLKPTDYGWEVQGCPVY